MSGRSSAFAWGLALLLFSLTWLVVPGDAAVPGVSVKGGQMRQASGEWAAFDSAVLATWPGPYELRWRLFLAQDEQALVLRVAVWRARGFALVDIDKVTCIAAVPEGSELHLEGGRTELHAKPLERLLPLLPPNFFRCHRTWIVNLAVVKTLHSVRGSRGWLELEAGRELPVGRSRLPALRERLAQE